MRKLAGKTNPTIWWDWMKAPHVKTSIAWWGVKLVFWFWTNHSVSMFKKMVCSAGSCELSHPPRLRLIESENMRRTHCPWRGGLVLKGWVGIRFRCKLENGKLMSLSLTQLPFLFKSCWKVLSSLGCLKRDAFCSERQRQLILSCQWTKGIEIIT